MAERTMINIELHVNEQILDLTIPNQVSSNRLKELLVDSLSLVNIELPTHFSLEVKNKPIHLDENVILAKYPLADGDQLAVKEIIGSLEER
ncbi:EsaB/YukD family protein [Bacillus nitratireducens]|uniref:EsaB/YukD family protein n=1 Tax=Bacillus TaxID=1386 RepID=UPI00046A4239|nr:MULTISPECIES: EsaB/YukD family protein [Bacillus]OJD44527.1 type VII secretion protein, YukD family [Bacillus nitratireducens]